MGRILLFFISLLLVIFKVTASPPQKEFRDEDLPKSAEQFLTEYFMDSCITHIDFKHKEKSYLVLLSKGEIIKFNEHGEWISIDCKSNPIPYLIIPSFIRQEISRNYGPYSYATGIVKIKRKLFVTLENGIEIIFKKKK